MAASMRTVLAVVLLALLAAPSLAAPVIRAGGSQAKPSTGASAGVGAGSGCVPKGGPYQNDCKGKCCGSLRCSYTSVGGGYFCT
jgi:hypothetical protein